MLTRTPVNKGQKLPPEPLTQAEVGRLLNACSTRAPTGIRNRALIILLWRGQLRISEALALKPKDMDVDTGTVRVLHGKGDRARTVGLDPMAMAVLQQWLDVRAARGTPRRAPVICTLAGEPVKDAYVRALLPRLALKQVNPCAF